MSRTTERLADEADRLENDVRLSTRAAKDKVEAGVHRAADAAEDTLDDASSTLEDIRERTKSAVRTGAEQLSGLAETGRESLEHTAHKARETYEDMVERLENAYHDGFAEGRRAIQRSADSANSFAREHPLAVVAFGVASGILLGALLPRSRTEDRLIGPYADDITQRAQSYGEKAVQEGRKRVERAAREVKRDTKG